jgi:hypothetical protein
MVSDTVLDAICTIPRAYRGGKSALAAVRQSGYAVVRDDITPADIARHFELHPAYVEDWCLYSLDKRTSGGWYLVRDDHGWTVGSLSVSYPNELYDSGAAACANFALREIETIYCTLSFRKPKWPLPWTPLHRDGAI